jgi:hypothetical protein
MRVVIRLVAVGLLILLVVGIAAAFFLDRGARIAVERGVGYALAVKTSVGSVSIRPMQGSVDLAALSIANPAGFSDHAFLTLDDVSLSVKLSSLLKDEVDVPSLELSGLKLRLEGRGTKTNYATILDNLKRLESTTGAPKEPQGDEQGTQKRFVIHELWIRNTTVEGDFALDSPLGQLASTKAAASLPEIHLQEVGNGKSLSLPELSAQILKAILEAAAKGNIPGLSGDLAKDLEHDLSDLKSKARDVEHGIKDLFKDPFKKQQ